MAPVQDVIFWGATNFEAPHTTFWRTMNVSRDVAIETGKMFNALNLVWPLVELFLGCQPIYIVHSYLSLLFRVRCEYLKWIHNITLSVLAIHNYGVPMVMSFPSMVYDTHF